MIRLGMLDFDTSHAVEFTQRLNHVGIGEDQWVDGARVVVGCAGESRIAPERIAGFHQEIERLGVPLVGRPDEMLGRIDGLLLVSLGGAVHFERARPFLEAGLPCFIDKPFTCGVADAWRIADLAARKRAPVFSSSALRYAPAVVKYVDDAPGGRVLGAMTYGPATLREGNPGLFHYGIHAIELLYTLMGPGCRQASCTHTGGADVVTGQWADGRVGTVRGLREGETPYGFVAFAERAVHAVPVDTTYLYRELLKQVVDFFRTGKPPVPLDVTIEIVALIEASLKSARNHGAVEPVVA